MRRTSSARRLGALAGSFVLAACSQLVQYTDEITDGERTGRTLFVTTPATLGGSVGFIAGVPLDLVLLPATWVVYSYQKAEDPLTADPISTLLFPSFVCWRAGKLLGVPFDLLEFAAYRAWLSEPTLSREEREAIEYEYDGELLNEYPVKAIYPTEEWRERAAAPTVRSQAGGP